jgi:hypothetical protein
MLTKTNYTVNPVTLQEALAHLPSDEFRVSVNKPRGNFFYDPWDIKDEFKGSVWEKLLSTITEPIGEARVISLAPQMSYHIHSDIDDRFHLNIANEASYLINLDDEVLYKLSTDGIWYSMNAGKLHTASNFGRFTRVQFVVRKLLTRNVLVNPVRVQVLSNITNVDDSRFLFDNTISPWLNYANKNGIISNFVYSNTSVEFDLEKSFLGELENLSKDAFKIVLKTDQATGSTL